MFIYFFIGLFLVLAMEFQFALWIAVLLFVFGTHSHHPVLRIFVSTALLVAVLLMIRG